MSKRISCPRSDGIRFERKSSLSFYSRCLPLPDWTLGWSQSVRPRPNIRHSNSVRSLPRRCWQTRCVPRGVRTGRLCRRSTAPALADELVEWAAIYRDGNRFAFVGNGAPRQLQRDIEEHSSTSRIVGGSEIVGDTGSLGRVAVALKASGVGVRRRETRQAILFQGLIVGVLGALLAFVVVAPIGRAVNLVLGRGRENRARRCQRTA